AAAEAAGHPTDRTRFRVCRDVFIADTDAEAKRRAIDGALGETWRRYLVPIYKRFGIFEGYFADANDGVESADVTLDWIADNVWLCGSPETVADKINATMEKSGPWGMLCMNTHDAIDDPEPWFESMHRLANEVLPRVQTPVTA
ncbi:MAG TPA: LLM class flavin-dependent oxidoreductase, partial [Baekduia sp.]|nr:LLM class flavin-dependent oxidoreductase [Baekduia sp.]